MSGIMPLISKKGGDFAKKDGAGLGGRGKLLTIQAMRGNHVSLTKALLGPTNTGKTHRAVERMLEHSSGMIGLPLRLLAREVYDRVSARVGERVVALVTGEEKRIPAGARYWICTVESMPVSRPVDFLAVDEIQLAAHRQRGHVFTDRLLHARGEKETWFMGADTMRARVEQLLPTAQIQSHPRFSQLRLAPSVGLGKLPPRSVVVAFSAAEVYDVADRLRRRRGGAAVVLGALSPRARNAQVAMYQSGDVDFMVATDAIGMGLNMDIDHVAFASLRKFDGQRVRGLTAAELGQIAGRAGRHLRDGSFGALSPQHIAADMAFSVEQHRFAKVQRLMWRHHDLEFASIEALVASLQIPPRLPRLRRVAGADDDEALLRLGVDPEVRALVDGPDGVRLLWDVCRIPDFRKLLVEHHVTLLREIFLKLATRGRLDADFLDARLARLETTEGDIEALMMRMEFIRTWSYVVHHPGWVDDSATFQARTIDAEDRLSEALHERLVERFVERRGRQATPRARKRSRKAPAEPSRAMEPNAAGPFAKLAALRDALPSAQKDSGEQRDDWIESVIDAGHEDFRLEHHGRVSFDGRVVGLLSRGSDRVHPEVKLKLDRGLAGGAELRVKRRMQAWARDLANDLFEPLRRPSLAELSASGRGLLFQLEGGLTTVRRKDARKQLDELSPGDRESLRGVGVRWGKRFCYLQSALVPERVHVRAALCAAWRQRKLDLPNGQLVAVPVSSKTPEECYLAVGFAPIGPLAVRIDVLDRAERSFERLARKGAFAAPPDVATWLDCSVDTLERVLLALGYAMGEEGFVKTRRPRRRRRP